MNFRRYPLRALVQAVLLASLPLAVSGQESPVSTPADAAAGPAIAAAAGLAVSTGAAVSEPALQASTGAAALPPIDAGFSSATVNIAAFRRTHFTLSMAVINPFERLLGEDSTRYHLLRVENLPCHLNGVEYMYKLPERFQLEPPKLFDDEPEAPVTDEVETLATEGGTFALVPPSPEFMEAFLKAAGDPGYYSERRVPWLSRGRGKLTRTHLPGGGEIHTLELKDARGRRSAQWRDTIAQVYKIRIGLKDHDAVFLFNALGGEGRLASALERLKIEHGGDMLILNRGEIFVTGQAKTTGTLAGYRFERMGVDAAVPDNGEMSRLDDVLRYRAESRAPIKFLAANLVYSTDTAKTVFAPYEIFPIDGVRVAVFGLIPQDRRGFLSAAHAKTLAVSEPISAARALTPELRKRADLVVALTNLSPVDNARLRRSVAGIDLIVGDTLRFEAASARRRTETEDPERAAFDEPLLTTQDSPTALSHVTLSRSVSGDLVGLKAVEERILLDDTVADSEGYAKFEYSGYGVSVDTRPALLPSARGLKPQGGSGGYEPAEFWRLAASLAADITGAEAAVVPQLPFSRRSVGAVHEDMIGDWFRWDDRLAVFELPGDKLQALIAEVRRQERPGESIGPDAFRLSAGGLGAGDTIHGVAIDGRSIYRVAGTERLLAASAQFPGLSAAARVKTRNPLRDEILAALRRGAAEGWGNDRYQSLIKGLPLRETGLWLLNIRDVNLNVSNTRVVADDAFAQVPNARVRGFDELLIGAGSKTDLLYLFGPYKWVNTLEAEYSKSRLRPPGQAAILNTPKNRLAFRTLGTIRTGSFPWSAVGRSFGPSLGMEYEGQLERLPLTRRRHVFSFLPGVELFDGTVLRTVELSGNLRRDYTPLTPINNYGFRLRSLLSRSVGTTNLQGELLTNYFIRTPQDTLQDLRLETNATLKLHVPVYKSFSVAPFIDFYYFMLKVRPITGYSAIMGVSLSFTRLWKPQYEGL